VRNKRDEEKQVERSETGWTNDLLESPHDAPDKARRVRSMFNAIAPRYELVNRLFSGGRDAYWRRRAVGLVKAGTDDDVLDIACGTGDFSRTFLQANVTSVTGCDFAHEMLVRARGALAGKPPVAPDESPAVPGESPTTPGESAVARGATPAGARWCECDAQRLPFSDGSFSITSCAFGVRNFQQLGVGLSEMCRVLRPNGRAVILEFSKPKNALFRGMYELYANRIMPIAATVISGDKSGAYRYLPRSVVSFASVEDMCKLLKKSGFAQVRATPLTLGVVTVYVASRD
jgi:demethylmenaquinone methyltransferase / 2-methoxy-6-polyprenyl-1,4-benzoquinol methylase